jgi:arylsulfatase A
LYGYRRRTTPFLESVAAESTVYTQARAPSNWSLPVHVSLFTGLEAHEHRVTVHDRLLPGNTVFERLESGGYDTGLFTENGFIASHDVGLKEAFQTVESVPDASPDEYDTTRLNPGPDGFYYADAFSSWLSERDGSWAACVNVTDAHRPFEPRHTFDRWGEEEARTHQRKLPVRWERAFHGGDELYWKLAGIDRLYDGGIRQADAVIDRLFDALRTENQLEETLIVICGDHGDGFGQPGRIPTEPPAVSHIVPMHETLLHVPLLVRPPGGGDGRRCHRPATLTAFPDAVESVLDGQSVSAAFARERVFATKQPVTADLRDQFEDACDDPSPFLAPSQAVYRPDTDDDSAVPKRYYWGDTAIECCVHVTGAVSRSDQITPKMVEQAFTNERPRVREPLGVGESRTWPKSSYSSVWNCLHTRSPDCVRSGVQ